MAARPRHRCELVEYPVSAIGRRRFGQWRLSQPVGLDPHKKARSKILGETE
jgi:hypothetical protein